MRSLLIRPQSLPDVFTLEHCIVTFCQVSWVVARVTWMLWMLKTRRELEDCPGAPPTSARNGMVKKLEKWEYVE